MSDEALKEKLAYHRKYLEIIQQVMVERQVLEERKKEEAK
jgi:hypothetical protein